MPPHITVDFESCIGTSTDRTTHDYTDGSNCDMMQIISIV